MFFKYYKNEHYKNEEEQHNSVTDIVYGTIKEAENLPDEYSFLWMLNTN